MVGNIGMWECGVALQMEHPEFFARFDMDKEQAIASRKGIMEMAKKEGLTMYGMHFPTEEGIWKRKN